MLWKHVARNYIAYEEVATRELILTSGTVSHSATGPYYRLSVQRSLPGDNRIHPALCPLTV